jgi:hypothetical protein
VHDEPEVGLVVAHAQRAGRDDGLQVVGEQALLDGDPPLAVDFAAVGRGGDAVRRQPARHELGVALGERVDDPRAFEPRQPRRQPGQPVRATRQVDHLEAQARAPQRAAVGAQLARVAHAELVRNVGHHAVVRGGGRAEHGDAGGQPLEHLGQPTVVRAKVVAPIGDAVRLVDGEQADSLGEQRQHRLAELRVVQALGADEQQVDRVVGEQPADLLPRAAVGRVDRVRPDAQALDGGDLVAHQGQQRRDDQRRSRAALAQEGGGEEVHRRLAPAGALHAEHARAVLDQVADRLELMRAKAGVRPGQLGQQGGGPILERQGVHHTDTRA